MKSFIIILLIICSGPLFSQSDSLNKRVFHALRLSGNPPEIDGYLQEDFWTNGTWESGFIQQTPIEGSSPTQPSYVKIFYDENNLYVAFVCKDNKEKIIKRFSQRDEFNGDVVGIAFDSYHNERTAYEFNVTAAGQKVDLMHTGSGNWDESWNAVWDVQVSFNDTAWVAEYLIPFSQLRYNNDDEHIWGLHIWRWIHRNYEESQWQLIPVNAPLGVHNFGLIDGIKDIRTSRQAEILPYASLKFDHNGTNENPYIKDGSLLPNAGLDAKIGISSDFTLDATINPDFGQVEADPAELNLTAYETYFNEKRPFFLEGKDIFDFEIEGASLFYSRRIGATPGYYPETNDNEEYTHPEQTTILGSGKITGRTSGGLSVGVLETVTAPEYGKIYSPNVNSSGPDTASVQKFLTEPLTNYFASRLTKEANGGNTVFGGAFNSVIRHLNTNETEQDLVRSAHTGGVDFIQYIDKKNYYVQANAMFSHLKGSMHAISEKQKSHIHRFQREDAPHLTFDSTRKSLTGSGGYIKAARQGGKVQFGTNISYWSPELNTNDIGYMPEADVIQQANWISFNQNEPKSEKLRLFNLSLHSGNQWTFGGEKRESTFGAEFVTQFKSLWTILLQAEYAPSYYDVRMLRGGPALYSVGYQGIAGYIESNQSKKISASADYTHYWNINKSSYDNTSININIVPLDRFKIRFNTYYEYKHFAFEYFEPDYQDEPTADIYLIGQWLNQKTVGMTARFEVYINPEISFQYYANPLLSAVEYPEISRVDNPHSHDVKKRFYRFDATEIDLDVSENQYIVKENNGMNYRFTNPNVSFSEFRSNFVFKWEYKLGSVFYLVWSHQRGNYENISDPKLNKSATDLFHVNSENVIMMKFSYWFNV